MEVTNRIELPAPVHRSTMAFEDMLKRRTTVRVFADISLDLDIVSQLLWAAQGINTSEMDKSSHRSCPSAGGAYPLILYVLSSLGVHVYDPQEHVLELFTSHDLRRSVSSAALSEVNQHSISEAPLTVLLTVNSNAAQRISPIWEDVLRFVYLEAGHVAQSLALQAQALGLGLCTITSYAIRAVYRILKIPLHHRPIYLLPIGYPAS